METNKKSEEEQKKTSKEQIISQNPARPTSSEAQLRNLQEVDMNTVQKEAGTYRESNNVRNEQNEQ